MINLKKSKISYAEVYDIIQHSNNIIKEKIPDDFIKMLKDNMDTEYIPNIDYKKGINEKELQHETKIILGIIYRDFLCDDETKKVLISKEKKKLAEIEIEKVNNYNIHNYLKTKNENNYVQDVKQEQLSLIEYKQEKWYHRIWNKVISIFK